MTPAPLSESGSDTLTVAGLSFYDHRRQNYGHLPIRGHHDEEFMVGDYGDPPYNSGVGPGGEFKIALYRFNNSDPALHPQLQVHSDAYGSLRAFIESGALDLIEKSQILTTDDLAAILLGAGLTDCSDRSQADGPVRSCPACGQTVWKGRA